jgi:DNA polymerase
MAVRKLKAKLHYEPTSAESRDVLLPQLDSIADERSAAAVCKACPLWKNATQTVFGEGNDHAKLVIVGEQPGDKEDIEGKPFVGPAGGILRKAMEEAGLDITSTYVTNAVKHFKFEPRGKRRIHSKPGTKEIKACYPWLKRELELIQPQLVLVLGATAVTAVFGKAGTITKLRGRAIPLESGAKAVVTVHPSSLLRIPDKAAKAAAYKQFVKDLKFLKRQLAA